MTRRKLISVALVASFLVFSQLISAAHVKEQAPPPVRRIDHIMIRTDDVVNIDAFFTETLQLPVAWPLATRGGVTSGGVGFGTANVEAIQFPGQAPSHALLVG